VPHGVELRIRRFTRKRIGTSGIRSSASGSNRLEEHTAIALVNLDRFWLPGGGWFRSLDYQVPLKAKQADARVGKIDLLEVSERGGPVVVELKVRAQAGSCGDTPLTEHSKNKLCHI